MTRRLKMPPRDGLWYCHDCQAYLDPSMFWTSARGACKAHRKQAKNTPAQRRLRARDKHK